MPEFQNTEAWPQFVLVQKTFLMEYTIKSTFVSILIKLQRKSLSLGTPIPEILFSFPVYNFIKEVWRPFKVMNELPTTMDVKKKAALAYFKEVTANWYATWPLHSIMIKLYHA